MDARGESAASAAKTVAASDLAKRGLVEVSRANVDTLVEFSKTNQYIGYYTETIARMLVPRINLTMTSNGNVYAPERWMMASLTPQRFRTDVTTRPMCFFWIFMRSSRRTWMWSSALRTMLAMGLRPWSTRATSSLFESDLFTA